MALESRKPCVISVLLVGDSFHYVQARFPRTPSKEEFKQVPFAVDSEQFLFSSKIRKEERKTSKCASVTCERRCPRFLGLAVSPLVARTSRSQLRSQSYLFCVLPHGFSRKRDRSKYTSSSLILFTINCIQSLVPRFIPRTLGGSLG